MSKIKSLLVSICLGNKRSFLKQAWKEEKKHKSSGDLIPFYCELVS